MMCAPALSHADWVAGLMPVLFLELSLAGDPSSLFLGLRFVLLALLTEASQKPETRSIACARRGRESLGGALQERVRLDYVDAVLRRLGGDGGREKLSLLGCRIRESGTSFATECTVREPRLRSSYTSVEVSPELNLCFGEELALAECAQADAQQRALSA